MSIIRVASRSQYVVLDQGTAADVSLSWEAKGLHLYLLSRPDSWKVNPEQLAAIGSAGRDKVYRLLKELMRHGYAVRNSLRNATGQIVDHEYVIYEKPLPENKEVGVIVGKGSLAPLTENQEVVVSKSPGAIPLTENQEVLELQGFPPDIPLTENQEVAAPRNQPLPDLPDTAKPDRANQDHKYLTNTEFKLTLNSASTGRVRSEVPREASPSTSGTPDGGESFAMFVDWFPRDQFSGLLLRAGISPTYPWDEDLLDFWLYRIGKGEQFTQAQWEHKFFQNVSRNKQYRAAASKPIAIDWQPTEQFWAHIADLGIDVDFARALVPEFILYWSDAGGSKPSWTSTFLESVKTRWQFRLPTAIGAVRT